jgi:hypothetical protein
MVAEEADRVRPSWFWGGTTRKGRWSKGGGLPLHSVAADHNGHMALRDPVLTYHAANNIQAHLVGNALLNSRPLTADELRDLA